MFDVVCITVPPGHRAVIFDRFQGVKPQVSAEGTHFMIPIIQKPVIMEVRTTPRTIATTTGTKGEMYPYLVMQCADVDRWEYVCVVHRR